MDSGSKQSNSASADVDLGLPIHDVCLAGGTHGNELTGIYIVSHIKENLFFYQKPSFKLHLLHSNPEAIKICRRYVDTDMNRLFPSPKVKRFTTVSDDEKLGDRNQVEPFCEILRARDIYNEFKGVDLLVDIHNTNADMGSTFILKNTDDTFILQLISYIQRTIQDRTFYSLLIQGSLASGQRIDTDLTSIAKHGLSLELGPQAHGTLIPDLYFHALNVVKLILDFCDQVNNGVMFDETDIIMYEVYDKLDFPRNEKGDIEAMVHPSVNNWKLVRPNDPLFVTFNGKVIVYEGSEPFYPVFVNEGSYFEKNIAILTTKQKKQSVLKLNNNAGMVT